MQYIFLDNTERRCVTTTNFNQHIRVPHLDRIIRDHDMIYIRSGNWKIVQDNEMYELSEGDVLFLHAGHRHYGIPPSNSIVNTCFVHFKPDTKDKMKYSFENNENYWMFPAIVHCKNNPLIEHYFHRIIHSYWSSDSYERKKADAYLELLLAELCTTTYNTAKSSLAEDIVRMIKMNRFISTAELANHYSYSARTLSAAFKSTTNTTIHRYQIDLKCRMADELMRCDSSITLREVASTYGFYDEYHFGKCYKSVFGYSPKRKK